MAILKASLPFQLSLSSIPPATRSLTLTILGLSLLHYGTRFLGPPLDSQGPFASGEPSPYLVIVPGLSYYFPWTLATAAFVETSIIELLFSLLSVPLSLRYLERLWGAVETLKFVAVVTILSNAMALVVSWIEYFALGNAPFFLYNTSYSGTMALQAGILVAFTQLIPEHHLQLFGVLKIRVKRLPMLYVGFSNVMCLLAFQAPFILIQFGWLVSWIYLRFYKRTIVEGVGDTYGDRSETFAFVTWFPPIVQRPLSFFSDFVYHIALRLHLVQSHPGDDTESGLGAYASLPGSARAEAERRRAMALRALDQRMPQLASTSKMARPAPAIVVGGVESDARPSAISPEPPQADLSSIRIPEEAT